MQVTIHSRYLNRIGIPSIYLVPGIRHYLFDMGVDMHNNTAAVHEKSAKYKVNLASNLNACKDACVP